MACQPINFSLPREPAVEAALAEALQSTGDYRVLRRLGDRSVYGEARPGEAVGQGLLLDTETTGRDPDEDEVIELGMVSFSYSKEDGRVLRVLDRYNELRDPGRPIPEEASRVNGITDEMVAGKALDIPRMVSMVQAADFVVAHNSQFDRAFMEVIHPIFKEKRWGCSRLQVDWAAEGIGSAKLDYVAYRLGFFYEAHRAEADCLALLHALAVPLPESKRPALASILAQLDQPSYRVWARGAPFGTNELMKPRGYRWGPTSSFAVKEKTWYFEATADGLAEELQFLRDQVYGKPVALPVEEVGPLDRFSRRRQPAMLYRP